MLVPDTVIVGGFKWSVIKHAGVAEEGSIHGSSHMRSQTFYLDPNNTPQKEGQTFLHEIMHAVWYQSGLELFFPGKDGHDTEEKVIHALSMGLYQVLKDNKLTFD